MRKRFAVTFASILVVSLTFLAGCGSASKAPGTDGGKKAAPPVPIVWSTWGSPEEETLYKKVLEGFQAKHPEIQVTIQTAPWANYFDKLQTQWAGGSSPDVMFLTNIPLYSAKGVLMDLTPLVKQNNFNLADYPEKLLAPWKGPKGELWGTPRDNDTKVIYYNKALFDAAKVPYPTKDWTWEEMRQTALKLTKRDGNTATQYGLAFEPAWWRLWVWSNGGELFDDGTKPTKSTMDDPKAAQAIQFLADLINKDKVTPPYDQIKSSSSIASLFQAGKLAMAWGNAGLLPTFTKITDFKWDMAVQPKASKDKPLTNSAGGAGYTISSTTKHPQESFVFWSYLNSPDAMNLFATQGLVPATKSGMAADGFAKGKAYDVQALVLGTEAGHPAPLWTYWPKASTLMDTEIQKALVGQGTGAEAVKKVATVTDDYIKNPN